MHYISDLKNDLSAVHRRSLSIAMVTRSFCPFGGLELYTYKLIEGLLEYGIAVTVVCQDSEQELVHPKLRICKFPPPSKGATKSETIRHVYREASKAIEKFGPFDLVHTQHFPVRNADLVTFHNHTVYRLSKVGQKWERLLNELKLRTSHAYRLRNEFDRQLVQRARGLIFTSHRCQDDFRETYDLSGTNPTASYAVAYPGAEYSLDSTSCILEKRSDRSTPFTFLFVGKGYRKKGLDVLLNACRILSARNKSFRLLIAGLEQKPLITLRLATMGLIDKVVYLGFQKDMDSAYAESSAIVLPSRVEPFGMAPLEGMLRGVVPIVSRVSGVSEVITNNYDGLILENHLNAEELANHMCLLIDNLDLVSMLSKNAIVKAKSYTWDKTVDATVSLYTSLLRSTLMETFPEKKSLIEREN